METMKTYELICDGVPVFSGSAQELHAHLVRIIKEEQPARFPVNKQRPAYHNHPAQRRRS